MTLFDLEKQRVCVRVVYDGLASAGKTTNLRQLAELFASQPTCEIFSPAEMDGRTLYFDWLQIAAGMVCGFPLVCQIITVPGQIVLTPRRRHLLSTADVVVYVCDSDEQAGERAIEGLAPFDQMQEERSEHIPLVIQANKQDQTGALSGAALLAALGRPGIPVVEAIASDGIGVVDTFAAAVRAAVRSIQARMESGAVRVAVQPAETAAAALSKLSQVDVDPEWAAEMLLEEASAAFGPPGENELAIVPDDAPSAADPAAQADREPETLRPERLAHTAPTLPTEHVPTGFIWPAHTGRAALRALSQEPSMQEPASLDGDGSVRLAIGEFVLSTSHARRFESPEAARQALVRAARERTQLGPLLAPETVLVAQPAPDAATWLWTIEPRMPTVVQLASELDSADPASMTLLTSFGAALADALHVEAKHSVVLSLSPRCFGVRDGFLRYLGEIVSGDGVGRDSGRAIEASLVTLSAQHEDLEPVVAAFEVAIATRFAADELAKLARFATWSEPASLPPAARVVRQRVQNALLGGRRAA